ncbi:MAG: efflux RND transporter periplasmic adaptor subunit [Ruminobacter sp.]|uniref:efflux RND transporter periplasmic adaptor subunit n=1 Tax=Ruminobacter sp. TaxID=2774296 RepID=UPI001B016E8E|nr:efflux RND transporter periplasmic adaptor subunit [Ruminobacter sp.]MBO6009166.1 efflux RND transporter periplasmic adaptor subunit [Ruminobacter sp.]MBP3748308.1 efflux RND transporter periplasmic adaptor subunit [Ruminobacter sp.]
MWKIIGGLLSVAVICGVLYAVNYSSILKYPTVHGDKSAPTMVRVAEVEYSSAGTRLPLVGRVHANRSVQIVSEVTGRISKVFVSPTQMVKTGDLLVQLENERHKALLKESEVVLKNYQRRLEMSGKLINKGVVSQDSYEQIRALVKSQTAVVDARQAELNARDITAPFDGILSLHNITAGQFVKPETVLFQLDDISQVYVDFPIPERFLSKIVVGQEVTATTDAWPGHIFSGKVKQIDTHINVDTLAVGVRIYFDNQEFKLLDGMMLEVSMNMASEKLPVVPLKSLVYAGEDRYVFVVNEENKVFRRKVVLGPVNGAMVAVNQGLRVGTSIVVEGVNRIHDGDTVTVIRQEDIEAVSGEVPLKKKDKTGTRDQML